MINGKVCKLVTFDVTNTILKFKHSSGYQYGRVARKYGLNVDEEKLSSCFKQQFKLKLEECPNFGAQHGITYHRWWRSVVQNTFISAGCPAHIDGTYSKMSKELVEEYTTSECWERNPGAKRLFQSLRKRGFSVGIISNFDERLKTLLAHMELLKLVDFIICSYEVKCYKPDKKIFNLALLACPEVRESWECTHVGDDAINDYQGARDSGWNALVLTDNPDSGKLSNVSKEHIVTDIMQVRDFMLNQLK